MYSKILFISIHFQSDNPWALHLLSFGNSNTLVVFIDYTDINKFGGFPQPVWSFVFLNTHFCTKYVTTDHLFKKSSQDIVAEH